MLDEAADYEYKRRPGNGEKNSFVWAMRAVRFGQYISRANI